MTFDEIIKKMRDAKLDFLACSLESAVLEEARCLRSMTAGRKQTQKFLRASEEQAKAYFSEEITAYYEAGGGSISPDKILNHRRAPTAWAIANKLLQYQNYCCPVCSTKTKHVGTQPIYDPTQNCYFHADLYQCENGHDLFFRGEQMTTENQKG